MIPQALEVAQHLFSADAGRAILQKMLVCKVNEELCCCQKNTVIRPRSVQPGQRILAEITWQAPSHNPCKNEFMVKVSSRIS